MTTRWPTWMSGALCALMAWAAGAASAQGLGPDVSGGKDHPIVSRFAGSQLVGYQQLAFEAGRFYLPAKAAGMDPAKELDRDKPVSAEGQVTRLVYVAPELRAGAQRRGPEGDHGGGRSQRLVDTG
jgi:hypothetical protein